MLMMSGVFSLLSDTCVIMSHIASGVSRHLCARARALLSSRQIHVGTLGRRLLRRLVRIPVSFLCIRSVNTPR